MKIMRLYNQIKSLLVKYKQKIILDDNNYFNNNYLSSMFNKNSNITIINYTIHHSRKIKVPRFFKNNLLKKIILYFR